MNPARLKAYFYLLLTSIIWGVATPVIKFTLGGIATLPFLTYRFGISSGVALLSSFRHGLNLPRDTKTLVLVLAWGFVTTTVSLGLLFLGMENTTVLETAIITAAAPLIITAVGARYLKEHVTLREKVGMGIALVGTALVALRPIIENTGQTENLIGNLLVVAYLITNTVSAVWAKELVRKGVSEVAMTNASFIIGFVSLAPFALVKYGTGLVSLIVNLPLQYQFGVFYMALLSGSLAYMLWVKGQKTIEIGEASLFAYLYPIFEAPLAVFWLKETITTEFIIGAAIIAVGVLIAETKKQT